jgi:hypothetical protein
MQDHPVPEDLGAVSFSLSCAPAVQAQFDRGVALLHSFSYQAANVSFRKVADDDPHCAMAHWGMAMTAFHPLWEPQLPPATLLMAAREIAAARTLGSSSPRERAYIQALSNIFTEDTLTPFPARNQDYERSMAALAHDNPNDVEAQVFYALALLGNAPPADRTHARQRQALAILEPLDRAYPDHPGITHYIIHACDSTELASRGLAAARKYAQVAPSAPHALHMPSHIFTRLGMWQESIASNISSSRAARQQGMVDEELHAMDYLVYAYLQLGREDDARLVLDDLAGMRSLNAADFKIGYAVTAMRVRFAVERRRWEEAATLQPVSGSPPQVAAIAVWARALGRVRSARPVGVGTEIAALQQYEQQLHTAGDYYGAAAVRVLRNEIIAWDDQARGNSQRALAQMRTAAEEEDSLEKLPVTPGPIIPAREQLGELLLAQRQPSAAATAFQAALAAAPGRRGGTQGLVRATQLLNQR